MAAYVPTEELVFTSGGAIRRGWETTRARYRQRYGDDPSTMGELAFEVLEIQSLGACFVDVTATPEIYRIGAAYHLYVGRYESYQQADGGWGESCASYLPGQEYETVPSTASQTAWGVMALVACGRARGEPRASPP